jgi:hypothetical protein
MTAMIGPAGYAPFTGKVRSHSPADPVCPTRRSRLQHRPLESIFSRGHCTPNVALHPGAQIRLYRATAYEMVNDADTGQERRFCSAAVEFRLGDKPRAKSATDWSDTGRW